MLKLMKYEFRKTMFSKLVILVITAIAEVLYLAGVFLKLDRGMAWGIVGLVLCCLIGLFYVGIESLLVFHRDLNTKQSYMLFLLPKNSYEIMGAKVLENGLSLLLAGCFFAALAAIDLTVGVLYIGGLQDFLDLVRSLLESIQVEVSLSGPQTFVTFLMYLSFWLMNIVTGFLAIVLSATVFAGKKFSGTVSFLVYLLFSLGTERLTNFITPDFQNEMLNTGLLIVLALAITAVMYALSGWIMERKLSV